MNWDQIQDNYIKKHYKNDDQMLNLISTNCYVLINIILLAAYFGEFLVGARTLGYFILFSIVVSTPTIISKLIYKKKPESKAIKHISGIGYGIAYAFILFTTKNAFSFVYAFLILVIVQIYRQMKYTLSIGTGILAIILSNVFYQYVTGQMTAATSGTFKIQIVFTILMILFSLNSAITLECMSKGAIMIIEEKNNKNLRLLANIKDATNVLHKNVTYISNESDEIAEQGQSNNTAVNEIANGVSTANEVIQNQLEKSIEITNLIDSADNVTKEVQNKFKLAKETVACGDESMNILNETTILNKNASNDVNENMIRLVERLDEAKVILETIQSITKQINILTLNASIEAERAGEFGKGFAVVADEITKLSKQTNAATKNIAAIFDKLEAQSNNATESVKILLDSSEKQAKIVENTKKVFSDIHTNIEDMNNEMEKQLTYINNISVSNQTIGNGISELSSFSEELTAVSEETQNTTEKTIEKTRIINNLIAEVMEETEKLKQLVEEN